MAELEETCSAVRDAGGSANITTFDVSVEAEVDAAVQQVLERPAGSTYWLITPA